MRGLCRSAWGGWGGAELGRGPLRGVGSAGRQGGGVKQRRARCRPPQPPAAGQPRERRAGPAASPAASGRARAAFGGADRRTPRSIWRSMRGGVGCEDDGDDGPAAARREGRLQAVPPPRRSGGPGEVGGRGGAGGWRRRRRRREASPRGQQAAGGAAPPGPARPGPAALRRPLRPRFVRGVLRG